jgi:hypothetical protein
MSGLWGPINLVAQKLICRIVPPCFEVVCWRENEAAHDDGRVERSLGTKTFSREQGPNFDLVGTSQMVVVCEIREAKCTTCWSGSSLQGVHRFKLVQHSQI